MTLPIRPLAPCQCGHDCGLTFHPHGPQRFHPECPWALERKAKMKRDRSARVDKALKTGKRGSIRCRACEGMPHRRDQPRCWRCKEPYEPEPPLDVRDFMYKPWGGHDSLPKMWPGGSR